MQSKTLAMVTILVSLLFAVSAKEEISRQQLEAQVRFFHDALVQFGARTPDEAVELWVKGDQTRNGVYKYAVSCEHIKQFFEHRWGEPEKNFWIIGGSSPWLTGHTILRRTNRSPTEVEYLVQYEWATSAGPEAPTSEELLVKKVQDKWCVDGVTQVSGFPNG